MKTVSRILASLLLLGAADASARLKLDKAESAVVFERAKGKSPKLTAFEVDLDGSKGLITATLEEAPSTRSVTVRRVGLDILGALYFALPGDPVAPLGPGGRLEKQGSREDLVWEVRLVVPAKKKGPPEVVESFVFAEKPEPVGHDTGEPSFHLPKLHERGPWWLPKLTSARAGCVETEWNPWHRERYWYDATGATPVRIETDERPRPLDVRLSFATNPQPTVSIQTPRGTARLVLESPTRLVLDGDGRTHVSELVREEDRVVRIRQGAGAFALKWQGGTLVQRDQLAEGVAEPEYTTRFQTTLGAGGTPQRFEESASSRGQVDRQTVVLYSAAGRARITAQLVRDQGMGMRGMTAPAGLQLDNVRWHSWNCRP